MKHIVVGCLACLFCQGIVWAQDMPKPATVQQIKDAVDWAKVPRLDGAIKVQTFFNHITYQGPGTFQQAADFYLQKLPALGWQNDKSLSGSDQKDYLSLVFEKAGMRLSVSGYRSQPGDPMTITLMNFGNVDVSLFPKADDAQMRVNNKNAVFYSSKQTAEQITSFCRKFMKERGWTEKEEEMAATWAKEGRYVLKFQQNAMECILVASKTKEGNMEVSYSSSVQHDLSAEDVTTTISGKEQPTPATLKEAMAVVNIMKLPRMEKAAKAKHHKELYALPIGTTYVVPDSIDDAAKFYRELLKKEGWTELSPDVEMELLSTLKFEKSGYLLMFSASRDKKDGLTSVSLMNTGNVDLRKLPFPPGAKFHPNRSEFINTETTLSVDDAFEFYRKELTKLGWKEVKQLGQGTARYTQNGIELRLEIGLNLYKKTAIQLHTGMK